MRSLDDGAVALYQEKLTIIDLRGEDQPVTILARAREAIGAPWAVQWQPAVSTTWVTADGSGGMAGRFTPDPRGFFLIGIGPEGQTIEMEHYTREGVLDHRLGGASASTLASAVLATGLVDDHGHAV